MGPDFGTTQQPQKASNTVVFDATKNELYKINDAYKSLQRKLKGKCSYENVLKHIVLKHKVYRSNVGHCTNGLTQVS